MWQYVLPSAYTRGNTVNAGGWNNCSDAMLQLFVEVSLGLHASVASSQMSPSSRIVSFPIVVSRDKASAAWCLTSAWCTISKSSFENRRRFPVSRT